VLATIDRMQVDVPVFVRTQYLAGIDDFTKFNTEGVVACELEGGLEVLSRVLRKLEVPKNLIIREIDNARALTIDSERKFNENALPLHEHKQLSGLLVENILLMKGSRAEGKSARELDLADKTGVLLIAIKRGDKLLIHRLSEMEMTEGDTVYCIGQKEDLESISEWFDKSIAA
jgi:CPA2 family monovalent cation:H+ antiporter-2